MTGLAQPATQRLPAAELPVHVVGESFEMRAPIQKVVVPVEEQITQRIVKRIDETQPAATASYPYVRPLPATEGGQPMTTLSEKKGGGDGGNLYLNIALVILVILGILFAFRMLQDMIHSAARMRYEVVPVTVVSPGFRGLTTQSPARIIPPGTGQVTRLTEFDNGQAFCDKYVPVPTTFRYWKGSGPSRKAHCE